MRLNVRENPAGKRKPSEVIDLVLQVTETPLGERESLTAVALNWKEIDEPVLLVEIPMNIKTGELPGWLTVPVAERRA